ncbi:MAG: redoxin family protein [Armatimonadetes bacterium]|nr:redoxin family protein [Armatimonadota bacterium]
MILPLLAAAVLQPFPFTLTVGSPAPPLRVGKWLRGPEVSKFEKGTVYVIDSWASWCGPCKHYMPHMSDLQDKYAGKVLVIGMDGFEQNLADGDKFFASGSNPMRYRSAQDQVPTGKTSMDGRFVQDWIIASGNYSKGIPFIFVIDREGKIAWLGHPKDLDAPLAQIVDGTFDEAAFKAKYEAEMLLAAKTEPLRVSAYRGMVDGNAKLVADSVYGLLEADPVESASWASAAMRELYGDGKDPRNALAFARRVIAGVGKDSADILANISRSISLSRPAVPLAELDLAKEIADRALALAPQGNANVSNAMARVLFKHGDKAKGIEFQEKAVKEAKDDDERALMMQALERMKKLASGG